MQELLLAMLVTLAALAVAELFLIYRELARLSALAAAGKDEPPAKGQTINVNVGAPAPVDVKPAEPGEAAVPAAAPAPESAVAAAETADDAETREAVEASRSADRQAASEAGPKAAPVAVGQTWLRPTPSGLVAKKCPKCGMENSAYRSECFNCSGAI
jgi:hypothetical protein